VATIVNVALEFKKEVNDLFNKKNNNWIAMFIGKTGSGKSYSALDIADAFSNRGFIIKHHLIFNVMQFFEVLNDPVGIKKGDILIFDEAGVGISSRDWQSLANKLIGSTLQTFRRMNIGLLYTAPSMAMLDKQARTLIDHIFEPVSIDRINNLCYCKVHEYQYNDSMDKFYRKRLTFNDETGYPVHMNGMNIQMPRKELVEEYEARKKQYTTELNKRSLEELKDTDSKKKKEPKPMCGKCKGFRIEYTKTTKEWWCKTCGWTTKKEPAFSSPP